MKKNAKRSPRPKAPQEASGDPVGIEEAVRILNTSRPTFYRWLREGKLKGMRAGRQWRFYRADLDRFLQGEQPRVDSSADMSPFVEQILEFSAKRSGKPAGSHGKDVVAALNLLLLTAIEAQATDIHLTPMLPSGSQECKGYAQVRVDGELLVAAACEPRLLKPLIERIKLMANLDVHQRVAPQHSRVELMAGGKAHDLSIATLPVSHGEAVTIRIVPPNQVLNLEQMHFAPPVYDKLKTFLNGPSGLLLIAGPAGSGKTTVLYSCLQYVAKPNRKVISIESPVLAVLPWVAQVPLHPERGLTAIAALRSAMRSAPNVLALSEVRDHDSLAALHDLALTGHLVMTVMHTMEAAGALRRMLDLGTHPFVISQATRLVIAQRLVRKLCPKCSTQDKPHAEMLDKAKAVADAGGLDWARLPKDFRSSKGCAQCNQTGFRGRTLIAEALEVTPEISAALRQNAPTEQLRAIAIEQGMITFSADGVRLAAEGTTTLEEGLRWLPAA